MKKQMEKGDRVTLEVLSGYVYDQHRPLDCRHGCVCGSCNGTTTEYQGTVQSIIYWMDNSVEAEVLCDDGKLRKQMLEAPKGDVCF